MGQHNSNFELASEARRAAERFDECEIKVIKETFKDLCHLNRGSTRIDKETFLQYLPLPGLLGERLFAVFDRKNSGEIDYEEFVCGLAVTCRGSWEEKVEFIFNLYDIHGQGAVNREELAALLNHVPKSIMRFGRAVSLDAGDPGPCSQAAPLHHNHRCSKHTRHNCHRSPDPPPTETPRHHQQPLLPSSSTVGTPAFAPLGRPSPEASPSLGNYAAVAAGAAAAADSSATAGLAVSKNASGGVPPSAAMAGRGKREGDFEDDTVVVVVGAGAGIPPPLTSNNLMQLHLASLSPAPSVGTAAEISPPSYSGPEGGVCGERLGLGGGKEKGVVGVETTDGNVSEEGGGREASASRGGAGDGTASRGRGGCGDNRVSCRLGSPRSEVSMEEGCSNCASAAGGSGGGCVATPAADGGAAESQSHSQARSYYAHWENFTNNDIVDQAFEDCDLNHSGKLSFSEFRLWVERNPMVTQFLQSVFPYDEHREWEGDRKHLPFIHNREFTASPMLSEAGGSYGDGDSSDEETRRLLIKARNTTRDPILRDDIDRLLDQHATGCSQETACGEKTAAAPSAATSTGANGVTPSSEVACYNSQNSDGPKLTSRRSSAENLHNLGGGVAPKLLMTELSPRSARVVQHQTVAKQGFLWKKGHRLRTWKQRWYVLVGNCIYYYQHEDDVNPCGVMFLTGSFVEPLQEGFNERKGFWGIEISRNNEPNHRRRLYTRSKIEQLKWVKELRRASAVVPIEDDFEIGQELGKGRFSRVCMCVNKHTLERKAVKIIMKEDMKAEEKDLLRAEIAIMKLVNHPNIIRMEAVYESKKDIFIVMELHSGGELFDRIVGRPRFTEDEAFTVIQPLVESVAYLHEMGIVHRDLKPENILCGNHIGDLKIADFGLSKMVMPDEIMKMPCGTLTYVAPEVLTLNGYGKEADIWSVGTIMYLLLRGRLPFDGRTREEIIENTIHGAIFWQNDHVWAGFSDDCKDLVLGMLTKDVTQRYKAKYVLRHPWITSRQKRSEEHPELFDL